MQFNNFAMKNLLRKPSCAKDDDVIEIIKAYRNVFVVKKQKKKEKKERKIS